MPRVALVHDWLTGMRGGERVLKAFAELYPEAPLHTLLHVPGSVDPVIENRPIHVSALQRLPGARRHYRRYLPLLPRLIEGLRIGPADLVLSSSSCVAKGIVPPAGARHLCYLHSPMRYLYDRYDDYFAKGRAGLPTRLAMRAARGRLRRWDQASCSRVTEFAANSAFIAARARAAYGVASRVIHPPVDTARFRRLPTRADGYYLMVSALVPYKKVDVAVAAFRGLDRRLVVAGGGPWLDRLRASAPPNVSFLGWTPDEQVDDLLAGCTALLMPNVEDFGIAPVEAQAAGKPVIALNQGGARETVRDVRAFDRGELGLRHRPTGLLYDDPTPAGLAQAVLDFEVLQERFAPDAIRAWAERFDVARFKAEIAAWVDSHLAPAQPRRRAA